MSEGRNIYLYIWNNFVKSLKPRKFSGKLVGKDYNETSYFETSHKSPAGRTSRWYIPKDKEVYPEYDIPPEWHAWLIHKRSSPPTEEEIQQNLLKMKKTLENAKALEKPKKNVLNEVKSVEKNPFPIYEDYEEEPGQKRKL